MLSLEIVNHRNQKLSEKVTLQEEELGEVVSKYFSKHSIGVLEYLRGDLSLKAFDLDTDKQFSVEVFHVLFDPILVEDTLGNDTDNKVQNVQK